jgi:RNA polymerase sigma factor (sigma-70 family)
METARAAKRGRRHNLPLRQLTPGSARRDQQAVDRAFESFYRKHVAEVYQYALAVLTNPADAEDVTQQTFLNAYRAFQKGERPHAPHNWLIKIAHNVCRMRWRQSSRRPQEVPLENVAEPASLDEDKPLLDEVLAALARLPFNQRAAIVMREVEGRSYAEIADVLDTTVPAVEALLFRARTNLKARRDSLGVLTLVPVPSSLSTFFGGGTAAMVGAGASAIGIDALLKGVAVVVAGLTLGGVGFKSVGAVAKPGGSQSAAAAAAQPGVGNAASWTSPAERFLGVSPHGDFTHPGRLDATSLGGGVGPGADVGGDEGAPGIAAGGSTAASAAGAGEAGDAAAAGDVVGRVTDTVRKVVEAVPPAPPAPLPPPPSLPVTTAVPTLTTPTLTTPKLTTPTLTTPTLTTPTVTTPTLPTPTVTLP